MSRARRRRGRSTRCSTSGETKTNKSEKYELLKIRTLKSATPNLRVINMYGISFVDDSHIEAFSSNCIQLAVLCVNYCSKASINRPAVKMIPDQNTPLVKDMM